MAASERAAAVADLSWFTAQGGRVDEARIPRVKPAFVDLRVDDRGYLWVRTPLAAGAEGTAFDVFDPRGMYQGRVDIPVPVEEMMPVVVRGDRLYTVVLAAEGHPQVVGYRLEGRG